MADSTQDTSSLDCIPEIYLERRSAQSTHHSHHGRVQPRGEGVDENGEQPTAEESNDDLVKEGFIPYNELKLHHLPEAIRTQKNLDLILRYGEHVVCVNNNQLSEKRNQEEEMKMPGVVLKGTGNVTSVQDDDKKMGVAVFTNRHVLYNMEELRKSTVDFYFDSYRGSRQVREMERTRRGKGLFITRQNSKVDFCEVMYEVDRTCKAASDLLRLFEKDFVSDELELVINERTEESLWNGIVCVISHPLGRWKHVSFGKVVEWRPQSMTFLHDAPTKPGSSGAPIIVITRSASDILLRGISYHEGVDRKTGLKIGHFEANFASLSMPIYFASDFVDVEDTKCVEKNAKLLDGMNWDNIREEGKVNMKVLRLGAFFPIFAAFILHPEKYCSRVLTLPSAPPCQSLSKDDVEMSAENRNHMSRYLLRCAHCWPGLFPPPISETAEPGADLSPFLTTESPCSCQAIVEAVVHTSRSDKDTGVFLRPDAVCGDFRQNPSWPWSLDRCGGSSGPGREPMLKHCLLKECLDMFRKTTLQKEVPLLLLVLIRKANDIVKQSPSQTSQSQHGCPGSTGTTNVSSAHTESDVRQEEASTEAKGSSPDPKQLEVVYDIFGSIQHIAPCLIPLSNWSGLFDISILAKAFRPAHPENVYLKNFHKTLDSVSHIKHHYFYDHPDSPPSQGVPSPLPQCKCGRPSWTDVTKGSYTVRQISKKMLESKVAAGNEKQKRPRNTLPMSRPGSDDVSIVYLIAKSLLECKSTYGQPCLCEQFLNRIDSLDNFRNSCDLISVFLTSSEVLLFNSRSLLRQYRQSLLPVYISSPVSVFGRPGQWAGGHTPEEVNNTAWKLIRAAFTESRFGRECLEVLERDTARREKLIDLYVDMKQLKFSGDIQEEKMTVEHMMAVKVTQMMQETTFSAVVPVDDNPTDFVMRTFLKLVPWPSWDRTYQEL